MKRPEFNQRKATEATAYLLSKTSDNREYLLLILKLLYIAERRALQQWGRLITWDHFVSMDHGPVLSQTYNLISGSEKRSEIWDRFISDKSDHKISLREMPEIEELSRAELKLLDSVYCEFGAMDRWDLVELTHSFPEWKNPFGSAFPIHLDEILRAENTSPERINQISEELAFLAETQSILPSL